MACLLWFAATLFFLGDTDKHSDDYHVHLINAATGKIDWSQHPWTTWPYFWRPLHLMHATVMNTLSYRHPWIGHAELAVLHGIVGVMLAALLRRMGIGRWVSWFAGVLFVVYPINAEPALWTSASCNAAGAIVLLYGLELARRQGIGPQTRMRPILIGMLAFIAACWYEPAAAGFAAAPLIVLAAGASAGGGSGGRQLRERLGPACKVGLGVVCGCLVYVGLLLATAPAHARGGVGTFATRAELPRRMLSLFYDAGRATIGEPGRAIVAGSIEQGAKVFRTPIGMAFGAAVAVAIVASLIASKRLRARDARGDDHAGTEPRPHWLLGASGVIVVIAAMLPLMLVSFGGLELRTLYIPLLGVAIAFAFVADAARRRLERGVPWRARTVAGVGITIALIAAVLGTIGDIGFQMQFRGNAEHDRRIAAQLRHLLPNPVADTTFVPLRVAVHGAKTHYEQFNTAIHSALQAPWSSTPFIQHSYSRTDISATSVTYWKPNHFPAKYLAAEGFVPGRQIQTRDDERIDGRMIVPWSRCVPFIVTPSGDVEFVPSITLIKLDGERIELRFPLVQAMNTGISSAAVSIVEGPGGMRIRIGR